MQNGEVPADPLTDLRTKENTLSVWLVDDDKTNLERLVAALMAKRNLKEFIYLLFDDALLSGLPIIVQEEHGNTPDAGVNHLHRNLFALSGRLALDLVSAILNSDYETDTMLPSQVTEYLRRSVAENNIDHRDLSRPFKEQIEA